MQSFVFDTYNIVYCSWTGYLYIMLWNKYEIPMLPSEIECIFDEETEYVSDIFRFYSSQTRWKENSYHT